MQFYNVAYLQFVVEFQHDKLLISGPLLSPTVVYSMLGDFAESAQYPTVHFNTQTATQPTQFSDFQLKEANSSNQSTVAPSDFPTVFPHKPTPSTSATPTTSASRTVKVESTAFRFRTRHK